MELWKERSSWRSVWPRSPCEMKLAHVGCELVMRPRRWDGAKGREGAHLVVHVDNDVVSRVVAARHFMYRSSVLTASLLNSKSQPDLFLSLPSRMRCVFSIAISDSHQ